MIDRVRNTVLTLLNKGNRGTIPPSEFNRLAGLAQRSIFENNFYEYSKYINMQNQRLTNSEYSDIPKNIREKIDVFAEYGSLNFISKGTFIPNEDDLYRVIQLIYKDNIIEECPKSIINMLNRDKYASPTEDFPLYTRFGDKFRVYPTTITKGVNMTYIRKPKTPKWTFIEVQGNPVFNPSANDFQDIELHPSDETELIIKILEYCGITIRSAEVVQASSNMKAYNDNIEQE